MASAAPRRPLRLSAGFARGAGLAFGLWLAGACGVVSAAQTGQIKNARFDDPTDRYAHGVLGDEIEWGRLIIGSQESGGKRWTTEIPLPTDHVFEDLEPRLIDLTLDGHPDAVMVVETDMARGAALALYNASGKIAETPHIGQSNRWLAPLGAADLDGDGYVELAYIDRPHLAKTLRIWRYRDGELTPVADKAGLTNHRIGQDFISGGIRDCGDGPEIVTADAQWQRIMVSTLSAGQIVTRDIGPFRGRQSLADAVACR
ncbi:FG-GAP repeat domain-containing protein [Phaeobacter marinintestinus]|uniref:FG-GAP repeat domain-containing protein n=1 Tax=Falsiphaeobacter marinintestinus TaxID=1492905 RepID=UPI001FE357EE|nr:VCBS repeat-containing protein [Phaeobacter marinintestinus]